MSLLIVVSFLLVTLLSYLLFRRFEKFRACVMAIKRKFIWNYFIRLILETSLEVLIASMIRTYSLNFDDAIETTSSLYAVLSITVIVLAIGVVPAFLYHKRRILRRKKFK